MRFLQALVLVLSHVVLVCPCLTYLVFKNYTYAPTRHTIFFCRAATVFMLFFTAWHPLAHRCPVNVC